MNQHRFSFPFPRIINHWKYRTKFKIRKLFLMQGHEFQSQVSLLTSKVSELVQKFYCLVNERPPSKYCLLIVNILGNPNDDSSWANEPIRGQLRWASDQWEASSWPGGSWAGSGATCSSNWIIISLSTLRILQTRERFQEEPLLIEILLCLDF